MIINTYNLRPACSGLSREGLSGASSKPRLGPCGGPSSPRHTAGSRAGREAAGAPKPEPCTLLRVYMVQSPRGPGRRRCGKDEGRAETLRGSRDAIPKSGSGGLAAEFRFPLPAAGCPAPRRGLPHPAPQDFPDLAPPWRPLTRSQVTAPAARPAWDVEWSAPGQLQVSWFEVSQPP